MANTRFGHVWVIDSAGSSLVTDEYSDIQTIRWVGGDAADVAEIADADGNVIWASIAAAAASADDFIDTDNDINLVLQKGFIVPTLGGGKLYLYLRARC